MTIRQLACVFCTILLAPHLAAAADRAPHEIGGFRLGASINNYNVISNRNFLHQVVVDETGGFRKGVIYYGDCARPGEIVKIKLKFKDSSAEFYRQILERYTKKFGKPYKFTGGTFGIVRAWKWEFTDKDNNRITLTLQHNLKNMDENIGNMIKLSMPDRIEAERKCFNAGRPQHRRTPPAEPGTPDWERLIPR
ncbi:hypothetical protein BMS3Bbin14_01795 [bacterium BMS3Bbin14]|nr:hypothetical protein BMS3Abin13_01660 [bacterium BMS3Abin13]GBE53306.1 hypothetical protein BMS3Bbin14_01795 [bacterium BMS3Bbin14]HDO31418.1 hypothetical protein [Desulfobacteraceae bacterium]